MTAAARAPAEQPFRTQPGLRGFPPRLYTAWKGRSGRRYPVGIHDLVLADLAGLGPCVAIAVARDKEGFCASRSVTAFQPSATDAQRRAWIERARRDGGTELHAHRCEGAAERADAAADLTVQP